MDHPVVKLPLCRALRRQLGDKTGPIWEHISSSHRSSPPPRQEVFTCQMIEVEGGPGWEQREQFCRFCSHLLVIKTLEDKNPFWPRADKRALFWGKNNISSSVVDNGNRSPGYNHHLIFFFSMAKITITSFTKMDTWEIIKLLWLVVVIIYTSKCESSQFTVNWPCILCQ